MSGRGSARLALILDVDDTLLKEVCFRSHNRHELVQNLRYRPSLAVAARYKNRLGKPLGEGNVIHYLFESATDENIITSAVAIRPGFAELIKHLKHAGAELLLASANDGPRTRAVCEQLRLVEVAGAPTLEEFGFRVVPREVVVTPEGKKDIAAIRTWAGVGDLCLAIVVDDRPGDLVNTSPADLVVAAPPFGREKVDSLLLSGSSTLDPSAEVEMAEQIKAATHKIPPVGVSLEFLRVFRDTLIAGKVDLVTASTADVCRAIVLDDWLLKDPTRSKLSFANLVEAGQVPLLEPEMVGRATHFTSHAWSYRFLDLVDSLEREVGDAFGPISKDDAGDSSSSSSRSGEKTTCYFWLDLFVVPQATSVTPPLAWWATTFIHAIEEQENFVLVWLPWDAPRCVTRAWCLWEISAALRLGRSIRDGTLQIAMPQSELEAFNVKLLDDLHQVQKAVVHVDAANAQAFKNTDKAMIFAAIEQQSFDGIASFDGLNAIIKRLLQNWIDKSCVALCEDNSTIKDTAKLAPLLHATGMVFHSRSQYAAAESFLRRAKALREHALGLDHEDTLETVHRLAGTLGKDPSRIDEAIELQQRVASTQGIPPLKRLRAQKMLAAFSMKRMDFAGAVPLLRSCLAELSVPFIGDQRSMQLAAKNGGLRQVLHCEKLLGTALRALGQSDEALALHEAVARDWCALDGEAHDNGLAAKTELAATLQAAGQIKEARKLLEYVHRVRIRECGVEHHKTKDARAILADIGRAKGKRKLGNL